MPPDKLTLRSIDEPSANWSRTRYTWRTGSIPPFSSLWITVLRFALLNRPKFDSLNLDLQGREAARTRRTIKFDSSLPWPLHATIDIPSFARMLGEPIEAFRWSSVGDLPFGVQSLFRGNVKFCPSCMAQGFHTVIFSGLCISRCPHHGDELLMVCPDCGELLEHRSKAGSGIVPRICKCDREWLSMRVARSPICDADRDEAMRDVVLWAEDVGQRNWTYIPTRQYADHPLQIDTLAEHIDRWRLELGTLVPRWLDLRLAERQADPSLLRYVRKSGFRPNSLARLNQAGTAFFSRTPPVLPKPLRQEPYLVFKSIRRYLVKHVLGNRVALLVWIGMNRSAPEFRRRASADPYIQIAWATLYWMQCSHWGTASARTWFKKLLGFPMFVTWKNDPTYHWTRSVQDHVVVHSGGAYEAWIVGWLNASALLDVWPTEDDFNRYAQDEGFLFPKGPMQRLPIRWWGWLSEDGRLTIGLYRRRPAWFEPAQRRSKRERKAAFETVRENRHLALRNAMSAPVIRLADDGRWRVEEPRAFPGAADLRITRLHASGCPTSRVGVGLDPRPVADPNAPWYIRSLNYPVCVTSADIGSGMSKLRAAVRTYVTCFLKI